MPVTVASVLFALALVAPALTACGDLREGERCTFRGGLFTGSWICATGFVCNTGREPKVCERPNVGGVGNPCGGDVNCHVDSGARWA